MSPRPLSTRALLVAAALAGAPAAIVLTPAPAAAQFEAEITANFAPPPLIDYDQPPIPEAGYIWTPGYWAWGAYGYYWVPGTWVLPPEVGVLWTPPWWGFTNGIYVFHAGYWGPTVGFYGGINYGFGYFGEGFAGGYWAGGRLFYNAAYNHFGGVHITNVYVRNVTNITINNRVSYNGPGGIVRQPTPAERAAFRAPHIAPTRNQVAHIQLASQNRELLASVNRGRPPIAATVRPTEFQSHVPPARPAWMARPEPMTPSRPYEPRPYAAQPNGMHPYGEGQTPRAYAPPPGGFGRPAMPAYEPHMAGPPRPPSAPRPAPAPQPGEHRGPQR